MKVSNPSTILDKNCAPMGPDILSSAGAGVWRNRSGASSDSNSILNEFLSVNAAPSNLPRTVVSASAMEN